MSRKLIPFFAALCGLSLAAPVAAQDEDQDVAPEVIQQGLESLDLTDQQREEVMATLRNAREERLAILEDAGIEPGADPKQNLKKLRQARPDLRALRQETDEELASILNEEQMEEFRQMRKEFRKKAMDEVKEKRKNQKQKKDQSETRDS